MSEDELQRRVLQLCREHKVLFFHVPDSRRADMAGFPDVFMAGRNGTAFAELKTEYGKLSREQTVWMHHLKAIGEPHYLWRPSDLQNGTIEQVIASL